MLPLSIPLLNSYITFLQSLFCFKIVLMIFSAYSNAHIYFPLFLVITTIIMIAFNVIKGFIFALCKRIIYETCYCNINQSKSRFK